jgi:hypothetical protein
MSDAEIIEEELTDFILFEKPILEMTKEEREQAIIQLRAKRLPSAKPKKVKEKKGSKLNAGIMDVLGGSE